MLPWVGRKGLKMYGWRMETFPGTVPGYCLRRAGLAAARPVGATGVMGSSEEPTPRREGSWPTASEEPMQQWRWDQARD